jgi:hypothetical protein
VFFREAMAENHKGVYWRTSGDGFFQNPRQLNAAYLRGQQDIANGSVDLQLTAFGYLPGDSVSDQLTLYIDSFPVAYAGVDTTICFYQSYQCQGVAGNSNIVNWISTGDGSFDDPALLNPIYSPGNQDTLNGSVELILTAYNHVCEDSISDAVILSFSDCPGIFENPSSELNMRVFPNPSSGTFNVIIEDLDEKMIDIAILDGKGQTLFNQAVILDGNSFQRQFDMHYMEKGTYYFSVVSGKTHSTVPIILQ